MKLPVLLAACILAMPLFPLSAETEEEAIEATGKAAEKGYVEKYDELIESGKLDPPVDKLPGKPDSLERRLWMAGYYSAVVELLKPAKAEAAREPGPHAGNFLNSDPQGFYSRGYISGQRAANEVAHDLFVKIRAQRMGEVDARIAAEQKNKKAIEPAPRGGKKAPR